MNDINEFIKNILIKIDLGQLLTFDECEILIKNFYYKSDMIYYHFNLNYRIDKFIIELDKTFLAIHIAYYGSENVFEILKVEQLIKIETVIEDWYVQKEITK